MERKLKRLDFPKELREAVRESQYQKCADCGRHHSHLEVHHVLPSCMGGSAERVNSIGLCPRCHARHDREALCNNRLFYEVLMEEGRDYLVEHYANLAGIEKAALASPDRLRQALRRENAPYYPRIEKPQIVTFADEPKSGGMEFYPFRDALRELLPSDD